MLSKHTKFQLRYAVEACRCTDDYVFACFTSSQQKKNEMLEFLKTDLPKSYGAKFKDWGVEFPNGSKLNFPSLAGGMEFHTAWCDEMLEDDHEEA